MNKSYLIAGLSACAMVVSGASLAGHDKYQKKSTSGAFVDQARVEHVEPIVRQVRIESPRQECWQQPVRSTVRTGHTSTVGSSFAGAVVGGVIGHQFGKGRGKELATIAGALLGNAIGHDAAHKNQGSHYETVSTSREVCETHVSYHTEERIDGYWVNYRYKGESYRTRMTHNPGNFIKVRVKVEPIDY